MSPTEELLKKAVDHEREEKSRVLESKVRSLSGQVYELCAQAKHRMSLSPADGRPADGPTALVHIRSLLLHLEHTVGNLLTRTDELIEEVGAQ